MYDRISQTRTDGGSGLTMMSRSLAVVAFALSGSMAHAYDMTMIHMIPGNEIASITAPEPEIEAPLSLEITFVNEDRLLIESDGLLEGCRKTLETAQADQTGAAVEIVVHHTANTMNGVRVTRCKLVRP